MAPMSDFSMIPTGPFSHLLANAVVTDAASLESFPFTTGELIGYAALILFIVLLNGFFVAAEFALVKVRESQIEGALIEERWGADAARQATQHLDAYLSASQLGITLASIALGMVGEPIVAKAAAPLLVKMGITSPVIVHSLAIGVAYTVVTFFHVVIGEQMPKTFAIRKALPTALLSAPPLKLFYILLRPAIWVLNGSSNWLLRVVFRLAPATESERGHSEEELRLIVSESTQSNRVTETEKDIFLNALTLNDRRVRDIITPRQQVIVLDLDEPFAVNMQRVLKHRHTRFPLVEGHLDHSIGLIHVKDLLPHIGKAPPNLKALMRELVPVPEMMTIDKLLRMFLDKHLHMALVVDEFGGAVGIVTLDNEELVGDIQDEFDEEVLPEFRRISDDEFEADGGLNLYELAEIADLEVESDEVTTVGGHLTHLLGHFPIVGEQVKIQNYIATIVRVGRHRVESAHFRRDTEPVAPAEESADEA
jgi:CBS domain containing-hemolysin-like protein